MQVYHLGTSISEIKVFDTYDRSQNLRFGRCGGRIREGGASIVKWTKKVFWYIISISFLVKRLKVVVECCINWIIFMATSIVVLNTQVYIIKLRSSKLINKSDVQKQMIKFGFEHIFYDLKYFELGFFFSSRFLNSL